MLKKLILILLFGFCLQIQTQNSKDSIFEDHSIADQLYTKCFKNLNQGAVFFEKYPNYKRTDVCSLMYCMMLLSFREKEAQQAGEDLLRGIATQLYREGNPVYMIMGMDSYLSAKTKNENLQDDDHIVYISYAECTSPYFLSKAADIINEQTMSLLYRNTKQQN